MGLQVEDATGSGYGVKVDNKNRLATVATTEDEQHTTNHEEGLTFEMLFEVAATAGDACVLYIKNTDDKDLIITGFHARVAAAVDINFYVKDTGTASGTTANTPTNQNSGSGSVATGSFFTGAGITGLTRGTKVQRLWLTSTKSEFHAFDSSIVVTKNQTFTMCPATSGVSIVGNIPFYFKARVDV